MNLVIDIGNSFAKYAVVEQGKTLFQHAAATLDRTAVDTLLEQYPAVDRSILATTRLSDPALEQHLEQRTGHLLRFTASTPVPLRNRYATPETLGADRLAAAVGAWDLVPNRELLIIDLGSALTIDRVSAAGEYLGGNISPGLAMRYAALHRMTDRLPQCQPPTGPLALTGTDTRQAIESGVARGMLHEIEGYIARFGKKNTPPTLFFTGRDANFFAEKVKNPIFVIHDLVLRGLNRILEYNAIQPDRQHTGLRAR